MYNLPYFKADKHEHILAFMHKYPFIVLSGVNARGEPVATHVPVLIEERGDQLCLIGHIMRQTDHHKAFLQNANVLAIFTGPHTYVSASWYVDQNQASTWNYLTVHAKGILNFLDEQSLINVLSRTTALFENDSHSPSLVEKLPEDYVQRLIKAIIAFEIRITGIDHVFKLSQNRDDESYNRIIEKLQQGDADAQDIALAMQKRKSDF